jgi:glycosyltransferase involved in cell wall biosynthesis
MGHAEKLKVLYVITKANFGGAQRYVYDLARAAEACGHEVVVAHGGDGLLGQRLRSAGIRTISLPALGRDVSLGADLASLLALHRLIRDLAPDVVHLNSSKVGLLGALAARWANLEAALRRTGRRAAILFTGHGWAFNEDRGALARLALRVMHWLTILLSHRVIAVSEETRRQVASFPFVRRRLVVVHNGVDEAALLDAELAWARITEGTPWRLRHPRKPPFVVGTLAELHRNKGLSYAVEAAALLRSRTDRPFVLAVLGEGEQRQALEEQIGRLGLEEVVLLAGYRPGAPELLRALDVFLLSSITEAFPYALLEAGMAGLPIVATRVGGIPDLVADADTGLLVPPRSPDAIAHAILLLAEQPGQRARLGQQVRARVADGFSVEHMTTQTFAIYHSVRDRLRRVPTRPPAPREDGDRGASMGRS